MTLLLYVLVFLFKVFQCSNELSKFVEIAFCGWGNVLLQHTKLLIFL